MTAIAALACGCLADFPRELLAIDATVDTAGHDAGPPAIDAAPDARLPDSGPAANDAAALDARDTDAIDDASNDGPPPQPVGEPCTQDHQCQSGACRGGACCESTCDEPCRDCNLGTSGRCLPHPAGTPSPPKACGAVPFGECGFNGLCDGQGNCSYWQQGAYCGPSTCISGTVLIADQRCDGAGTCVPVYVDCGATGYRCDPANDRCFNSCDPEDATTRCIDQATCDEQSQTCGFPDAGP